MFKILRNTNRVILLTAVILVVFYYRTCVRVLQAQETDHVNLLLHLTMLFFLFEGFMSLSRKKIGQSRFSRYVVAWMIIIVLGSFINWQGTSSFIGPVLWCVYFLVAFIHTKGEGDEMTLKISSTVVCVITLVTGYLSMDVAAILNQSIGADEEYEKFLNIIGFTVTTLPAVMMLKIPPLKWFIYFVTAIIAIVTERRMALIVVGVIAVLSLFETRGIKRNWSRWIIIVSVIILLFFAYGFITSYLADSLETAFLRMSSDEITSTGGSGRVNLWNDVINSLSNSNLIEILIGHGTLGVKAVTKHTAAHNELLESLFDHGVVGLCVFLTVHVTLIKRTIKLFKIKSESRYSYFMSYFVFLLYGTFGNVLLYPEFCLPLVTYWGYMEASFIRERPKSRLKQSKVCIDKPNIQLSTN